MDPEIEVRILGPQPPRLEATIADIQIGPHRIQSYSHGWQIAEEKEVQKGENAGDTYLSNKKYAPSLQSALLLLQDRWLRSSEAESVEGLLRAIKDFRGELAGAFAITVVEPGGR